MSRSSPIRARSGIALLLAVVLVLSTVPGVAAAETRSGGNVVVEAGETIEDDLQAFGGTIVVRGTVNGNLDAFGGDVLIAGEVTGNVNAFAGNVRVTGSVGGDVEAAAGNIYVDSGAEIGGSLSAAAGNVIVAGTVGGDAEIAGGTVTLAESAVIDGDVEYGVGDEGEFTDEGATVGGSITRAEEVQAGPWQGPVVPGWVFGVYGFFVNLILGAALLLVFPRFSATVAERVAEQPLWVGGVGLLTIIAVPVLLIVLVVTIVGIPLAIVGGILFGLLAWVALIYGRFAIGSWLVSLAEVENRWIALLVGLIVLGLAARIPWVGGLIDFVVLLLGLGAIAAIGYAGYRSRRTERA